MVRAAHMVSGIHRAHRPPDGHRRSAIVHGKSRKFAAPRAGPLVIRSRQVVRWRASIIYLETHSMSTHLVVQVHASDWTLFPSQSAVIARGGHQESGGWRWRKTEVTKRGSAHRVQREASIALGLSTRMPAAEKGIIGSDNSMEAGSAQVYGPNASSARTRPSRVDPACCRSAVWPL